MYVTEVLVLQEIQDPTSHRLIKQLQMKLTESSGGAANSVQNTLESIRTNITSSTLRETSSSMPPVASNSPPVSSFL